MNRKYTRMIAKILGLLLALMMVVGVCAPVMAAGENKDVTKDAKGSITVTSDESGWTATAYKVIDVNFDFDKLQPVDPAYTWNTNVAEWLKTQKDFTGYVAEKSNAVTETFRQLGDQTNAQSGKEIKTFTDALAAAICKNTEMFASVQQSIQVPGTTDLNNKAKAIIEGLSMGGYLVLVESTTGMKIYAPGFVNIYPSFNETQNKWVLKEDKANANMAIKSSDPTIVKIADKTTVAIGDTVTYTLEMDVPQYPENTDHKTFIFGDKLPSGLQLVSDSLKISSNASMTDNITHQFNKTEPASQDATFEYTMDDCSKLNCTKIYVQYKATVVSQAYDSRDNLKNTAYLLYDQNPYDQTNKTKRKTAEVRLYTYGIQLTKTNEKGASLAGADFVLTQKGETNTIIKVKQVSEGVYYPLQATSQETGAIIKSNTAGTILIKGLDVGTYTLEETKAPAGYTLPNENNRVLTMVLADGADVNVTDGELDATTSTVTGGILKNDSVKIDDVCKYQLNFTVTNSKSNFNLPITGGVGTVLFTVAGIMVMAGAVVLMTYAIRRKKRSSMK